LVQYGKHWPEQIAKEPDIFTHRLNWLFGFCDILKELPSSFEVKCAYSKGIKNAIWQYPGGNADTIYSESKFFEDMKKDLEENKSAFSNKLFYEQLMRVIGAFIYIYQRKG